MNILGSIFALFGIVISGFILNAYLNDYRKKRYTSKLSIYSKIIALAFIFIFCIYYYASARDKLLRSREEMPIHSHNKITK